jgi:hypothetical protein
MPPESDQNYGAAKTKPEIGARARPVSGHFLQMNSMCWAWYSAP